MTEREEFNAWVRSKTGTMFSPGKPESSDFYFNIWLAGKRSGEAAQPKERFKEPDPWRCGHCGRHLDGPAFPG